MQAATALGLDFVDADAALEDLLQEFVLIFFYPFWNIIFCVLVQLLHYILLSKIMACFTYFRRLIPIFEGNICVIFAND